MNLLNAKQNEWEKKRKSFEIWKIQNFRSDRIKLIINNFIISRFFYLPYSLSMWNDQIESDIGSFHSLIFSPFLLSSNLIEWSSSWIKLFRSLWLIYHQTFCWQQLDLIELSVNLSLFCISIALFPFHLNSYDFSRFVTVDWNQSIVEFLTKKNIASLISSIVSS